MMYSLTSSWTEQYSLTMCLANVIMALNHRLQINDQSLDSNLLQYEVITESVNCPQFNNGEGQTIYSYDEKNCPATLSSLCLIEILSTQKNSSHLPQLMSATSNSDRKSWIEFFIALLSHRLLWFFLKFRGVRDNINWISSSDRGVEAEYGLDGW